MRGKEYMKDEKNQQFFHRISRQNVGLYNPSLPTSKDLTLCFAYFRTFFYALLSLVKL